jgi:ABC-2 type transport system permease protein
MSAAVAATPSPAPLQLPRPPLARLTYVELRKMTDTRAGFWLLFIIVAATLAAAILRMALGNESERTLQEAFSVAQLPGSVLLPVLAILCVTSEWSQRTALTTFALVTKRPRILLAKVLAAVVIAALGTLVALLFAVVGTVIGSVVLGTGTWSLSLSAIGESFLLQAIGTLGGVAFGMVFLAGAPAIVLYFVLPTLWGIITSIVPGMDDVAKWADLGRNTTDLSEFDISGIGWARLATAVALWVAVPFVIGLVRIVRREVS